VARTVYEPKKYIKLGIRVWSEMFHEIFRSRELIWRLFVRNLSAKYKQTVLGYVWALIMPFVAIGTFVFLNRAGVLNIGETDVPYTLFALIGITVWQIFAVGIQSGTNSIVEAGGMIARINFPRETLVCASMALAIFEFLIKLVLIVICFIVFQFAPNWLGVLLFPFALLPLLILTLGLSLILSLVNCIMRDTVNIVNLLATFLMFLTPVLYPAKGDYQIFFKLNPLSTLVNTPRDLLISGTVKEPVDFFVVSVLSVVLLLGAWRIFHLVETKMPERV